MKKLTCVDLGGPEDCPAEFEAGTFDDMGEKCKSHVMERFQAGDEAHTTAMNKMKSATTEQQQAIMEGYRKKFQETPDE
ncbi:MAG: hypothetical protein O2794_00545 [bacterium]|nr:hypothetical protein [bacterium]